jgi:hypothetical protein
MSDNFILDYEQKTAPVAAKRPVFITVLCILSWVGCAFSAMMAYFSFNVSISVKELYESMPESFNADSGTGAAFSQWSNMVKYAYVLLFVSLGCVLLEVVSLIFIWKMKRIGFYGYLLSVVAPVATSLLLVGTLSEYLSYFSYAITGAFIFMYGLHFRQMR